MRLLSFLAPLIAAGALSSVTAQPEKVPATTTATSPAVAETGKAVVHYLNDAFAKVYEDVAPSVVIIEVSKPNDGNENALFDDLFFPQAPDENRRSPHKLQPLQTEGSGFIVRQDGYIFTNFHVIEGADQIHTRLKDGRLLSATVVGTDEKSDLAVIKVDAKELPVAQLGDSDVVRVGQFAFAIG